MDTGAVRNVGGPGRFAFFFSLTVILALVSGIGKQPFAAVGMYMVVDCLFGDACPFFCQSPDNLRRRPLLFRNFYLCRRNFLLTFSMGIVNKQDRDGDHRL